MRGFVVIENFNANWRGVLIVLHVSNSNEMHDNTYGN